MSANGPPGRATSQSDGVTPMPDAFRDRPKEVIMQRILASQLCVASCDDDQARAGREIPVVLLRPIEAV